MKTSINLLITSVILFSCGYLKALANHSRDTLYPQALITPYTANLNDAINFPLQNAKPIGDINGDGLGDFAFVKVFVGDERSTNPIDVIDKSVIVTDINHPKSAFVMYGCSVAGIGDYNGDGFDDMVDLYNHKIWFGNDAGANFESIDIDIPFEKASLYFKGDINNDGKSDFLLGKQFLTDSLLAYSIDHDSPAFIERVNQWTSFNISYTLFATYDYNGNGKKELCIAAYDFPGHSYMMGWYVYDAILNVYTPELVQGQGVHHEPVQSFPSAFSDINGDGLLDICHGYYSDSTFKIEANMGSSDPLAYFGESIEILLGNKTPFFYNGGDFNNDGADDWYSKTAQDTIVLYLGCENIIDQGFTKIIIPVTPDRLMIPNLTSFNTEPHFGVFYYNEDSIPDLLFNYWSYDEHFQYDTIGIVIFLGDSLFDLTSPNLLITPKTSSFQALGFGTKNINIGDYNEDGYEDWAILSVEACRAEIYFGGPVLDYNPDITILLPQNPYTFCLDMAVGDINGDLLMDIAISHSSSRMASHYLNLIDETENIYIFLGTPNRTNILDKDDASIILDEKSSFFEFGKNMSIVGDYNADGYNDLVVAGGTHKEGLNRAYVFFGGPQLSEEPGLFLDAEGESWSETFGESISACGDINGDGFDDFTLGYSFAGAGQSLVYFGGPQADGQYDIALVNPIPSGNGFGKVTPKTKGDFTGNGFPDLIQYDEIKEILYVFQGGSDFDNQPDYILTDTAFLNNVNKMEFVRHYTNSAQTDLLVCNRSHQGHIGLFFGSDHNKTEIDLCLKNNWSTGSGIASGDFDLDGQTDLFIGNSFERNYGYTSGGVVQHYTNLVVFANIEDAKYADNELTIFPNPTHSELQFILKTDQPEVINITIFDLNGQTAFQQYTLSNQQHTVNISHLPEGMYIIQAVSQSKSVIKKILKAGK